MHHWDAAAPHERQEDGECVGSRATACAAIDAFSASTAAMGTFPALLGTFPPIRHPKAV